MKKVILVLGFMLLFSCKDNQPYFESKYDVGELVYINNEAFQIARRPDTEGECYIVDKIDCRSTSVQACRSDSRNLK